MKPTWAIYAHSSEVMMEVDDDSVQLIVTSPSEVSRIVRGVVFQLNLSMYERVFKECRRVLKDSGVFVMNIGHPHTREGSFDRVDPETAVKFLSFRAKYPYLFVECAEKAGLVFISDALSTRWPITPNLMVDGIEPHLTFTCTHEHYFIFAKHVPTWYGGFTPSLFADNTEHPKHSIFNTDILTQLISAYTRVGDTVLDPMAGSCVVVPFAYRMGRNSVAYELSKKQASQSKEAMIRLEDSLGLDIPVTMTLPDGRKVSLPPLER